MEPTYIELRDTSASMLLPLPRPVVRARAYIVENNRIAIELETDERTYRLECSDVDARDFARLIQETVGQL